MSDVGGLKHFSKQALGRAPAGAGDGGGDAERAQAEPFGLPPAGLIRKVADHPRPGDERGDEGDELAPGPVLIEPPQGAIARAACLSRAGGGPRTARRRCRSSSWGICVPSTSAGRSSRPVFEGRRSALPRGDGSWRRGNPPPPSTTGGRTTWGRPSSSARADGGCAPIGGVLPRVSINAARLTACRRSPPPGRGNRCLDRAAGRA